MIWVLLVLVNFAIFTNCNENQRFVMCSENFYFNTSLAGKVLDSLFSAETSPVASAIECGRKCYSNTHCIGINTLTDSLNDQQSPCELIFAMNNVDTFLDLCLFIDEHEVMTFFIKETYEEQEEGWQRIFETDGIGKIVYGDEAAIKSKIQNGESVHVLLEYRNDGYDFLVNINMVNIMQTTLCAQSVHNFGLDSGNVFRTLMLICISGKIEMQVWRLWSNEMVHEHVFEDVTAVWFSDGRQRTEVVGLNGLGDIALLRSGINSGQEVSTYQKPYGYCGRIINSMFVNSSFIVFKHPWEYAISVSNGEISMRVNLYWFSLVFSTLKDMFVTRWHMESDQFISKGKYSAPMSYMLDKAWMKIDGNELGDFVDQGKHLRAVFDNRAESINLIMHHVPSGIISCGVDRILETRDQVNFDSTITQLFTVLTSTGGKVDYIVEEGEYTIGNVSSQLIPIDWVVDKLSWTAVKLTSSTRELHVTRTVLSEAFDSGKHFRVKLVIEEVYEYFFTADNVIKTEEMLMASYHGYGFDGKTWLLNVWSNGTVRKTQHSIASGTVDIFYDDVDMWWFIH